MSRLPALSVQISFSDGPEADWQVASLQLRESLNQVYRGWAEIETEELSVGPGELLGASCELLLQRGEHPPRVLHALVLRIELLGQSDHRLRVRVELGPALALAATRQDSRIWQERSVQDIVAEVLGRTLDPHGRSVDLGHLQRGAQARDYCAQYRERDLAFVCRLLEEEGITWLFGHDLDHRHEVLRLIDDNDDCPAHANLDAGAVLPIIAHNPDEADIESVQGVAWMQALTTTSVAISEFDPASPGAVSQDEAAAADARGLVRRIYDHDLRRVGGDLGRRAQDWAEALRLSGAVLRCESNAALLELGRRFTLEGFVSEGTSGDWIVTAIDHSYGGGEGGDGGAQVYRNRFECVPANAPIRPLELTPKPRVLGPQTATVVGGGEIDVDAQGRIQVQLHWQENPGFAAGASCRVRCAQSWAGAGWGAQFIPRVGMEVVVEFLEGNPDRPLVTGCVYNGSSEPPFALPGSSTQSGWRSNSSPGGGGSNELRFEDAAGSEQIYVHGQKDWVEEINNDARTQIGRDQQLHVGRDRTSVIGHDRRERVVNDQSLEVGGQLLESVGGAMQQHVGASQTVTVGAARSLDVATNHSVSVGQSASELVTAAKSVTVGGAYATIVGAAMNTSVGGLSSEEVGGIKSVSVGASSSESVVGSKQVNAASISHSAAKDLAQSAGQNMKLDAGKDIGVSANGSITVQAKAKGQLVFDESLTIQVGKASITLKKNGEIVLDGVKITAKGKKSITLQSKKIDQN